MRIARQDDDNDEEFGAPSVAIKIKYDLKRLACMKLSKAIIDNELRQNDAEQFMRLMDISYSDNLAKVALFNRKLNERKPLPLPEDVGELVMHINEAIENFNFREINYINYSRAVTIAQAKLISFLFH